MSPKASSESRDNSRQPLLSYTARIELITMCIIWSLTNTDAMRADRASVISCRLHLNLALSLLLLTPEPLLPTEPPAGAVLDITFFDFALHILNRHRILLTPRIRLQNSIPAQSSIEPVASRHNRCECYHCVVVR